MRTNPSRSRGSSAAHARVLAGILAAAALVVGIACSGGHEATAPWRPPAECSAAGQPAPGATQAFVAMSGFAFEPDTLRISAGTTVTWVNCEPPNVDAHTSTATGGEWDSGYLTPGAKFTHTFAAAGRVPYACLPHPFMHGTIVVQ